MSIGNHYLVNQASTDFTAYQFEWCWNSLAESTRILAWPGDLIILEVIDASVLSKKTLSQKVAFEHRGY